MPVPEPHLRPRKPSFPMVLTGSQVEKLCFSQLCSLEGERGCHSSSDAAA